MEAVAKIQACSLLGQYQIPNRNEKASNKDKDTRIVSVAIIKDLLFLRLSSGINIVWFYHNIQH